MKSFRIAKGIFKVDLKPRFEQASGKIKLDIWIYDGDIQRKLTVTDWEKLTVTELEKASMRNGYHVSAVRRVEFATSSSEADFVENGVTLLIAESDMEFSLKNRLKIRFHTACNS
jgi:hypothetical protein